MKQASLVIIGDEILSGRTEDKNLAYLAKCYSIKNNLKVYFYHVDHGLRKESKFEANQLKRQMKHYDINCKILKWRGPKPKSNIQSIAREKRYKLLVNKAKKLNTAIINQQDLTSLLEGNIPGINAPR